MTPSRVRNAFTMILGMLSSSTRTTNHTGPNRQAGHGGLAAPELERPENECPARLDPPEDPTARSSSGFRSEIRRPSGLVPLPPRVASFGGGAGRAGEELLGLPREH